MLRVGAAWGDGAGGMLCGQVPWRGCRTAGPARPGAGAGRRARGPGRPGPVQQSRPAWAGTVAMGAALRGPTGLGPQRHRWDDARRGVLRPPPQNPWRGRSAYPADADRRPGVPTHPHRRTLDGHTRRPRAPPLHPPAWPPADVDPHQSSNRPEPPRKPAYQTDTPDDGRNNGSQPLTTSQTLTPLYDTPTAAPLRSNSWTRRPLTPLMTIPDSTRSAYLGLFAGFLLRLATSDILPEAHTPRRATGSTLPPKALGTLFMWGVIGLTA